MKTIVLAATKGGTGKSKVATALAVADGAGGATPIYNVALAK